jgi:hypothetical protein
MAGTSLSLSLSLFILSLPPLTPPSIHPSTANPTARSRLRTPRVHAQGPGARVLAAPAHGAAGGDLPHSAAAGVGRGPGERRRGEARGAREVGGAGEGGGEG